MSNNLQISVTNFTNQLRSREKTLKNMLPSDIDFNMFCNAAKHALYRNNKLADVDTLSLVVACEQSARDGLMPDGVEAAFVPYGKAISYQPMVDGWIKLAKKYLDYKKLMFNVVYSNDSFVYNPTDGKLPEHIVSNWFDLKERGSFVGVYAVIIFNDDSHEVCVMRKDEVDVVRSKSKTDYIWKDFYEEKAKVVAIRRLLKRLIKSSKANSVMSFDDEIIVDESSNSENEKPKDIGDIIDAEAVEVEKPKRNGRGRPKGSKNKTPSLPPEPVPETEPVPSPVPENETEVLKGDLLESEQQVTEPQEEIETNNETDESFTNQFWGEEENNNTNDANDDDNDDWI